MTVTLQPAPHHKHKTLATLLAFLFGGLGLQRLYLRGWRDPWLWLHLAGLPAAWLVATLAPQSDGFFQLLPIMLSGLVGFLEALVLGLMPDEKWDARFNPHSGKQSDTHWPIAIILVATMTVGAASLIATISRFFDLLYTGGAYG
jgi:hypothetical protein